jgi:hypothetical protein
MKAASDTDSESFADYLLHERNSLGLLTCVAVGSGLVGLVTHFFAPPVWIRLVATFVVVLGSPLALGLIRVDTRRRAGEIVRTAFDELRLSRLRALELFLICLRANVLVRALRPRRVAERQHRSNVSFEDLLRTPQSAKTSSRHESAALAVAATAATIVTTGYWLMVELNVGTAGRVIMTGANESTIQHLSDGSVLVLDARSTVRVEVTAQQRVAHLVEGEAVFDVALDATRPFVVETHLADVSAPVGKFRVAIDSSVEIEVYEGVVKVAAPGAKKGSQALILQKGGHYRVPAHAIRAEVASSCGSVGFRGRARCIRGDTLVRWVTDAA